MGTAQYEPLAERYQCRSWSPASSRSTCSTGSAAACSSSRRAGARSRTPTRGPCGPRATRPPRPCSAEVFEVCDRSWRGIGMIPAERLAAHRRRSPASTPSCASTSATCRPRSPRQCRAGEVLQGLIKPDECEWFGTTLHPADAAWGRPWSRARAPAPPTTSTAGWRTGRVRRHAPGRGSGVRPERPAADLEAWSCPAPFHPGEQVVMGHGGGGRLSAELVEQLFLPAFGDGGRGGDAHRRRRCSTCPAGARLAFTTDTYVVQPLFFPGGDIGELAVNGTVNDLAMSGATPLALSSAFVLEEGLELDVLRRVAPSMGRAARRAGVGLVTGDTKVVERGHGDGLYVNTAGRRHRARRGRRPPGAGRARRRGHRQRADRAARHRRAQPARGPRVRHRDPLRHRAAGRPGRSHARRRAPICTCCGTSPGAASPPACASWRRRRGSASSSRSAACRCPRRSGPPAASSASTRCTWPTRASSSPSCAPERADAGARGDAADPGGERERGDRRCRRGIPGWSSPAPGSAGPGWSTGRWASSCRGSADRISSRPGSRTTSHDARRAPLPRRRRLRPRRSSTPKAPPGIEALRCSAGGPSGGDGRSRGS